MNKQNYDIYIQENYVTLKIKAIVTKFQTWMISEDILLCKISAPPKDKDFVIPVICGNQSSQIHMYRR